MTKIKIEDIKHTIKDIQILDKDLRKLDQKATPDIVGFYGEFIVWKELEKNFGRKGYEVIFGSGQSKADIVLRKGNKKANIEVKTSRRKNEWYGSGYGYALNIKKCKVHPDKVFNHPKKGEISGDFCYFDYLIAILLSDDLKKHKFYIFPRWFIEKHEKELRNRNKRFSSATHRMIFIEDIKETDEITKFDRDLIDKKEDYKNAWNLIELKQANKKSKN